MNYYNEIKTKLIGNEIYSKVKDYSKERNRVVTYYEVGKLLNDAGKEYGKNVIKQYSEKLVLEVGKKYNLTTLYRIRKFYEIFSNEKLATLWQILSWSHYRELIKLKNINEIKYYIYISKHNNLSQRQLCIKIKSNEYERLPESTKSKLILEQEDKVMDFVKKPIMIKNKYNYTKITEKILQRLILEDISSFLKELGNGFTFIDNEYKIKIGNSYNYIDLLLYNIEFNCYVVIELKVTELKKEHIGQIQVYMNYINKNLRKINQGNTIGIIIVRKDNKYIIEYCSDKKIFETSYKLF